jgi:hypothetical protein
MNSVAWWTCFLSRIDSIRDFRELSKVCRASATASKVVRNMVADRCAVFEKTNWGWQNYIGPRELLHGTWCLYNMTTEKFDIQTFAFGVVLNKKISVEPYEEPDGLLKPQEMRHIRAIAASQAGAKWANHLASVPDQPTRRKHTKQMKNFKDYATPRKMGQFIRSLLFSDTDTDNK